jgi:hypothetical protein
MPCNIRLFLCGGALLACGLGASGAARATDIIPYPNSGTVNPITYSFTAASTGQIDAYFVGDGGAAYDETLALFINGVLSPNGFGLDNHSSAVGQLFDLGSVVAGDTLVFAVSVNNPALSPPYIYSNPTLNGPYDGGTGINHIYSTAYTADPAIGSIPDGTYVGFEDLPANNPPDFNYTDEQYVFTNVATVSSVPEPASLGLLGGGLIGLAALRRRKA